MTSPGTASKYDTFDLSSPVPKGSRLKPSSLVHRKEQFESHHNLFKCLPDYQMVAKHKSEIINRGQMLVLSYYLPAMLRLQNWELLFALSRDGYSYHTFFDKLQSSEWTMLLIKDKKGNRFGAFCTA